MDFMFAISFCQTQIITTITTTNSLSLSIPQSFRFSYFCPLIQLQTGPLPSWVAVVQVLIHRSQKQTMYFHPKATQLHYWLVYFIEELVAMPLYCLLHLVKQTCQLVFVLVVLEFDSG